MRAHLVKLLLGLLLGCTGAAPTDRGSETDAPARELLGIGLAPRDPALGVGEEVALQAKAFFEDTTFEDVTDALTWTSTQPRVATVVGGRVTGLEAGTADIVGTDASGVSSKVTVTVKGADVAVSAVRAQPAAVRAVPGDVVAVSVFAEYADGSAGNVTGSCTFAAGDAAIASVDARGEVRAVAAGSTTMTATCPAGAVDVAVTVEPAGTALGDCDLRVADVLVDVVGAEVGWIIEVENAGTAWCGGYFVEAFLDRASAPAAGAVGDALSWEAGLGAGDTALLVLTAEDVPAGTYRSWVTADLDAWTPDASRGNNVSGPHAATVSGGAPDLVVTDFAAIADDTYTLYDIEVTNMGAADAVDFFIDLFWDPPGDPEVCEEGDDWRYVDRLAAGASVTWSPESFRARSGSWLSLVWADTCDDVAESNERNNQETVITP